MPLYIKTQTHFHFDTHYQKKEGVMGKELSLTQDTLHNNEYNMFLSMTHPNQYKHNKT
jgi:hypothetical protein